MSVAPIQILHASFLLDETCPRNCTTVCLYGVWSFTTMKIQAGVFWVVTLTHPRRPRLKICASYVGRYTNRCRLAQEFKHIIFHIQELSKRFINTVCKNEIICTISCRTKLQLCQFYEPVDMIFRAVTCISLVTDTTTVF